VAEQNEPAAEPRAEITAGSVISDEEANALLSTEPATGDVRPYDLCSGLRINRGRLPTLELLHEAFARQFRPSLYQLLKREPEITFQGVQLQKASEYLATLSANACIGIARARPMPGQVMFTLDPTLVYLMVDTYFGGSGRSTERTPDKALTPTELCFAQMIIKLACSDLASAWRPVAELEFEWVKHETNPHFVNVAAPADTLLVNRFNIEIATGSGCLDFVLPPTFVEPVRDVLAAATAQGPASKEGSWATAIGSVLAGAALEVRAVLTETEISLRDLVKLKPGDIVPIEPPREVTLLAGEVPVHSARFGISRGRNALRLVGPVRRNP
jgi:flagellar motor switch protein FliM